MNAQKNPFDDQQFNSLFEELYVPLCRFSMKLVGERVTTEDIVQEQFVYLWEHRKRFTEVSSLSSYLYEAVKHRSISYPIMYSAGTGKAWMGYLRFPGKYNYQVHIHSWKKRSWK